MIHSIAHHFEHFGIRQGVVGLEYAFLPHPRMGMLTHSHAKQESVTAKDCTPIMSELRLVKDEEEVKRMRESAKVADAGMKGATASLRQGMTESQVAAEAEYAMRQAGAEDFYRTYVSSGPRTNIAHGVPTLRKIESGDLMTIDLHPTVNGYTADLCRTVCIGKPNAEQQAAYDLYVKALETTIAKVKAGVGMMDLEQTMHGVFKGAGHGDHIFGPPFTVPASTSRKLPYPQVMPSFTVRRSPNRLRPTSSLRSATAASIPAPGGFGWRTPWW